MKIRQTLIVATAALLLGSIAAISANNTFFTSIGDLVFPFSPPLANGTAGTIDNMTIGATTPAAATFTTLTVNTGVSGPVVATTLSASGAVTGAGFISRFATPGPIGNTVASTGAFSTLSASGAVTGAGITSLFASPPAIGGTAPAAGTFTTLAASSAITPTAGVAAAGGFSVSPRLVMSGNWKPLAITDGTEVTCVATTSYVAEVFVPANMTVTGVSVVNATAVAGNIQIGLANSAGAPIGAALTASTAASGTAAYQRVPFAAPYAAVGPATYYVQLQCNNTGYKFRAHTVGDFSTQSQTSGTYGTFASFTPAATFTTAVGPVLSFY